MGMKVKDSKRVNSDFRPRPPSHVTFHYISAKSRHNFFTLYRNPLHLALNMDKGAARSKKRDQQLERDALRVAEEKRLKSKAASSSEAGPSNPRQSRHLTQKKQRPRPEDQSRDPALYTAKAVRTNAALNWASGAFEIPPASLEGITRVDLTGSGVTDVSWLSGSGVRWLGLSGCVIKDWSAVGTLEQLTGMFNGFTVR